MEFLSWIECAFETMQGRFPTIEDWQSISDAMNGTFEVGDSYDDMLTLLENLGYAYETIYGHFPTEVEWSALVSAILSKVEEEEEANEAAVELEYKQRKANMCN